MSVFAVTGAVLSLPRHCREKLGLKAAGHTAMDYVVAGCTGGALSPPARDIDFMARQVRLRRYQEEDDAGDINRYQ